LEASERNWLESQKRINCHYMRKVYDLWLVFSATRAREWRVIRKASMALKQGPMVGMLDHWRAYSDWATNRDLTIRAQAAKSVKSVMRRCYNQWKIGGNAQRTEDGRELKAFELWCVLIVKRKWREWKSEHAYRKQTSETVLGQYKRMCDTALRRAVDRWHTFAMWVVDTREICESGIANIEMIRNRRACQQWKKDASHKKQMTVLVNLAGEQALQTKFKYAYRKWFKMTSETVEMLKGIKSSCMRVLSQHMVQALGSWKQSYRGIKTQQARAKNALGKMCHKQLAGSFNTWFNATIAALDKMGPTRHFVMKLLHRQLTEMWEIWLEGHREAKRAQAFMNGMFKRMMQRGLSAAWEKWQQDTQEESDKGARMRRMGMRIVMAKLSCMFMTWRQNYLETIDQDNQMLGMFQRLMQRGLSAAWEKWQQDTQEQKELMEKMRYIGMRIMKAGMNVMWHVWREGYLDLVDYREATRALFERMSQRGVSTAWETWQQTAADHREQLERVRHLGQRFAMMHLYSMFATWCSEYTTTCFQKECMVKARLRHCQRDLIKAWNTWQSDFREHRDKLLKVKHIAFRVLQRHITAAYENWREVYIDVSGRRKRSRHAFVTTCQNYMSVSWHWWRLMGGCGAEESRKLKRASIYIIKGKLVQMLNTWKQFTADAHAWARCLSQVEHLTGVFDMNQLKFGIERFRANVLRQKAATKGGLKLCWRIFKNRVQHSKATQQPLNRAIDTLVSHLAEQQPEEWDDALFVAR